jgi:hypothetical protein
MFGLMLPIGLGVGALALVFGMLALALSLAYPVMWVWMLVDGILRTEEEYPGSNPNRKVLWVLAMALVHPAFIVYFFVVFMRARRTRQATPTAYTPTVAPPVPQTQQPA